MFAVWFSFKNHKMDSEFFDYLTAGASEPAVSLSGDMSNTGIVDTEWVSVPQVCRDDLHLYVNEVGELENSNECAGEVQSGTYIVEREPGQDECEQDDGEECTYLELKTVPVEAYSQVLYGGADGYSYVKTGQNYLESYRDEFGFYVSSLPDHSEDSEVQLPEETTLASGAEQQIRPSIDSGSCSEPEYRHTDSREFLSESCGMVESKADSVSLMKLRLNRIISNSEKSARQTTSNLEEKLNDSKVAPSRAMNIRVDMPVRKVSCPMVSQIAATILDRWKSMRPLGVTGLGDLPKYATTNMKAKLVNRPGAASSAAKRSAGDKGQAQGKKSRASRALERRQESQLALQQLQQMSKPVFKRRARPSGGMAS